MFRSILLFLLVASTLGPTATIAGAETETGTTLAPGGFTWSNPIDFYYAHSDGTRARRISEPRDPAIIREGGKIGADGQPADLAMGYWVGAAVADNIWGPYRKQPQVFLGGHTAVFTGPDGNEWFSDRGEAGDKALGQLCVDPISFNRDGSVKPINPPVSLLR